MPTTVVTGATGLNGRDIIATLSRDPETWTKVYSMSRRQKPSSSHSNIQHSSLDLQSFASDMAEQLKDVETNFLFLCAYTAKDSEQENVPILSNLLEAPAKTGAGKKLKCVNRNAGLKQYGIQFGGHRNPVQETDPSFCSEMSKSKAWDYVVTYPQDVIAIARGHPMNLATSPGLYAAVGKQVFPNSDLPFPGSKECFLGMEGQFPLNSLEPLVDPQMWSQRFGVIQAYEKQQAKHGLDREAWEKATWRFKAFHNGQR